MGDELEEIKSIYGENTYNIICERLKNVTNFSDYENISFLAVKYGIPELISYIYLYKEKPLKLNKLITDYTNIVNMSNDNLGSVSIVTDVNNNCNFSPVIIDEYINDRRRTLTYINYLIRFSIRNVKNNYYKINKKYIQHYKLLYAY